MLSHQQGERRTRVSTPAEGGSLIYILRGVEPVNPAGVRGNSERHEVRLLRMMMARGPTYGFELLSHHGSVTRREMIIRAVLVITRAACAGWPRVG